MAEGIEATIEHEKSRLTRPGDCCMIVESNGNITSITYHLGHEPNGAMDNYRRIVRLVYDDKLKTGREDEWFVPVHERYDTDK